MKVSLEPGIIYPLVKKIEGRFDGFRGKKEEVENNEVQKEIGKSNSGVPDEKNEDFVTGNSAAGFPCPFRHGILF